MSIRRPLLDPILVEAAAEAGAEVWMGAKVTALVRDSGRVTGVRVAHNGSEQTLEARLVAGADGRNSTVARLAGSRKYNLTPNERAFYWSFFEDADPGAEPTVIFHRWSGNFVIAIPADSGLYQVIALPELSELSRFRQSLEESYLEYVRRCERCWARWAASSPWTPGGSAWPGIRTMSRSRRPWTPGRQRSKTGRGLAVRITAGRCWRSCRGQ